MQNLGDIERLSSLSLRSHTYRGLIDALPENMTDLWALHLGERDGPPLDGITARAITRSVRLHLGERDGPPLDGITAGAITRSVRLRTPAQADIYPHPDVGVLPAPQ